MRQGWAAPGPAAWLLCLCLTPSAGADPSQDRAAPAPVAPLWEVQAFAGRLPLSWTGRAESAGAEVRFLWQPGDGNSPGFSLAGGGAAFQGQAEAGSFTGAWWRAETAWAGLSLTQEGFRDLAGSWFLPENGEQTSFWLPGGSWTHLAWTSPNLSAGFSLGWLPAGRISHPLAALSWRDFALASGQLGAEIALGGPSPEAPDGHRLRLHLRAFHGQPELTGLLRSEPGALRFEGADLGLTWSSPLGRLGLFALGARFTGPARLNEVYLLLAGLESWNADLALAAGAFGLQAQTQGRWGPLNAEIHLTLGHLGLAQPLWTMNWVRSETVWWPWPPVTNRIETRQEASWALSQPWFGLAEAHLGVHWGSWQLRLSQRLPWLPYGALRLTEPGPRAAEPEPAPDDGGADVSRPWPPDALWSGLSLNLSFKSATSNGSE